MHHGGEGGEENRDKLARVTAVVGVHQMNSHQLHRSGLTCMGYVDMVYLSHVNFSLLFDDILATPDYIAELMWLLQASVVMT